MYFHLISSLHPCGNTVQLRVRARRLARKGSEVHIFTFQPVSPVIRESFEGIAQIHELNTHFALEPFWRILFTARKLHLRPRAVHVWGTELLAPGLHLAQYYNVCGSATFRHPEAFQTRLPILRRFHQLETNSSSLLRAILQAGNRGNWQVVPDELDVFPQKLVPSRVKNRSEFLIEQNLPADSTLIACVGPISRWKRWQWAVWSIDSIVRVHPEARLLLFDPDLETPQVRRLNPLAEHERQSVTAFARHYERENIVRVISFRSDFHSILPFMDYFWVPQTVPGSSLAALEAAAAGVPIVGHRGVLNEEIFPEGSFSPLPELPEPLSLASVTHNLWIHPELKANQITFAQTRVKNQSQMN